MKHLFLTTAIVMSSAVVLAGCLPKLTSNQPEPTPTLPAATATPTPTTTSSTPAQQYTLNDVAQHAQPNDCWLVIEGTVYDVTEFVANHPGGAAITFGCGKDATAVFNKRPNGTSHSMQARELLPQFAIGTLKSE